MQRKLKKIVDFAETKKERIIVYSNDYEDDKCLVGEISDGEIKIFFETENEQYNKDIGAKKNPKDKLQCAFYWILCNLTYIIWLITNDALFSSIESRQTKVILFTILSLTWFFIFSVLINENKYANNFRISIMIFMILDNVFIQMGKNIFIFIISILCVLLAVGVILDAFITIVTTSMMLYNIKKASVTEKSKHSAEHMMCNYIEKYQTYAKNVKDLKKCSRFSTDCGGFYGDRILEENLSIMISNSLLVLFLTKVLNVLNTTKFLKPDDIPQVIDITAIFMGAFLVIWLLIDIFSLMICNLLVLSSQFITTLPKKKIKYKDLKMAQLLSKEFIEWQYPDDIEPKKKTK